MRLGVSRCKLLHLRSGAVEFQNRTYYRIDSGSRRPIGDVSRQNSNRELEDFQQGRGQCSRSRSKSRQCSHSTQTITGGQFLAPSQGLYISDYVIDKLYPFLLPSLPLLLPSLPLLLLSLPTPSAHTRTQACTPLWLITYFVQLTHNKGPAQCLIMCPESGKAIVAAGHGFLRRAGRMPRS